MFISAITFDSKILLAFRVALQLYFSVVFQVFSSQPSSRQNDKKILSFLKNKYVN